HIYTTFRETSIKNVNRSDWLFSLTYHNSGMILVAAILTLFIFYLIYSYATRVDLKPIYYTNMDKYPVVIVGGGPVGLLLALRLTQLNVKCLILEKRTIRKTHSKAIGIHPPSMEILQAVNEKMLNDIIEKSVVVKDGICMGTGKDNILGSLRLDVTKKPFNIVLSCPQDVSESILEQYLLKMNPNAIQKGATVTSVLQTQDYAQVVYRDASGNIQTQKASFVIGCDG